MAGVAEIDENLIRRDLTAAQRAKLVAKRKAAYEAVHPETKHGGAPGKANGKGGKVAKLAALPSFTADTATKTGKPERTIRRDATRAKALGADLDRVSGTSLDTGSELDALSKMTPEQRAPIIQRRAAVHCRRACRGEGRALRQRAAVIDLQREIPEAMKPRRIEIGGTSNVSQIKSRAS